MSRTISDPFENVQNPETILIIKPSSLGDVVHTLPAVSAVKRRFPDAKLHWVVNTEWAPLLEGNPDLESIIKFPRRQWKGWRDFGKARRWAIENLGGLEPDITLDFQGLLRSGLLTSTSRAKLKIGFRQAREGARFFYNQAIDVTLWKEKHAVDRYLELIGGGDGEIEFKLPDGEKVADVDGKDAVILHPFSRGQGKSLSFAEVSEFCEAMGGRRVLVVGAGVTWPENMPFPQNAVDLLGKTSLSELIGLIRESDYFVSVDSGPMHLAAGITEHVLSIHTWTDPLMVGPYPKNALIYRDEQIIAINQIKRGQFPEERSRKREYSQKKRLLSEGAAASIAERISGEIAEQSQSFN